MGMAIALVAAIHRAIHKCHAGEFNADAFGIIGKRHGREHGLLVDQ